MRISVFALGGTAVVSCLLSLAIAQNKGVAIVQTKGVATVRNKGVTSAQKKNGSTVRNQGGTAPRRPLSSQENLPWPAPVRKNDPTFPPVLTPAEELKTFRMPPGYRVELVASDPLIQDPILAEFDGDGRLWVMEMQGWANGEKMTNDFKPVNDLVILEDTDHDGVYDKRTVFLDKLIMPRAFKILDHNCALVGEPPHLWKACDTNGDLKADTKELINDTFATQGVIEHGANGLYWGMDNMIYVSEHTWNVSPANGKFEIVPTLNRGQWGITQDDAGRIYRNVNTDALFTDYIPSRYFVRNPDVTRTNGLYELLIKQEDTFVWPIHPTLGVNRGYRKEVPRPDGSAYYYQGVSSPLIYRGTQLPKDLYGQAFVVDGPTNLVHLLSLKDDGSGRLAANDFYKQGEFLASTDERFRPVALAPGWDGSFYIVDMYRGVSQDEPIQTAYLRNYIGEHRLWEGIHYGRIFRVVQDKTQPVQKPAMLEESTAQLVAHLSNPDGWWRDTAQQLLVQRNDKSVVPALSQLASGSPDFRTRLQALWTLDGMNAITPALVTQALKDPSPEVRSSAVRFAEHFLRDANSPVKAEMLKKLDDPNWQVRRQLAASLGELPKEERVAAVLPVLQRYSDDKITVDAAVSSLPGQEVDAIQQLADQPRVNSDALTMLAAAVGKSRSLAATQKVLALVLDPKLPVSVRLALLQGAANGLGGGEAPRAVVASGRAGPGIASGGQRRRSPANAAVDLPTQPNGLIAISNGKDALAAPAVQVLAHLSWPGKPVPVVPARAARTPEEELSYAKGQTIYTSHCAGCHEADGQGAPHIGAALAGSRLVNGGAETTVRILVNGKEGSIGTMPQMGASMSDEDLAAVLTYIRGSWGNTGAPIHPVEVDEYRQMNTYRKTPWTDQELQPAPRRPAATP